MAAVAEGIDRARSHDTVALAVAYVDVR